MDSEDYDTERQRFLQEELIRLGDNIPTLEQIVAADQADGKRSRQIDMEGLTLWLDKAERAWLIVWVLKRRGKRSPHRLDTLWDAAKGISLTYNGITALEKLHGRRPDGQMFRDWILAKIAGDREIAEKAGKRYKIPSRQTIIHWVVPKPPPKTKTKTPPAASEPPNQDLVAKLETVTEERRLGAENEFYLSEALNEARKRTKEA